MEGGGGDEPWRWAKNKMDCAAEEGQRRPTMMTFQAADGDDDDDSISFSEPQSQFPRFSYYFRPIL
jgi:hypothetical protein